ncbi:hypothetical protein C0J52_15669 [Blattella germanica]|nr:hypothetical protein C0J52_15669 [Blattella germanica]
MREIELLANENADLKNQVEGLQSQSVVFDQDNYNLQSAYNALHEEFQNLQKRYNETALSEDKHKETLDEYVQKIEFFSNENKRLEEQSNNIQKELEDMTDLKTHYMNLQLEYNNIK